MRAGETVAEQQALALAAAEEFANEDVRHCAEHRPARRAADSQRHEGAHPLQRRLAGVCGYRHAPPRRSTPRRRRGSGFTFFATKPARARKGATLTAWELAQQNISHQIIADNAAGHLMQRGEIDLVIVGSDRVLGRTGEVANKIGTYTKAVLAARHGIPFYVAIPLSTIDWKSEARLGHSHRRAERERGSGRLGRDRAGEGQAGKRSGSRRLVYVRVANPTSGALNPGFRRDARRTDHRHHHAGGDFQAARTLGPPAAAWLALTPPRTADYGLRTTNNWRLPIGDCQLKTDLQRQRRVSTPAQAIGLGNVTTRIQSPERGEFR